MSFEIHIGGEPPEEKPKLSDEEIPIVKKQIDSNNIILNNWLGCKFRSDKMEYTKPVCCGRSNETAVGYKCIKLDILDLNPLICERCNYAEHKN